MFLPRLTTSSRKEQRARVALDLDNTVVYAIGDVHGRLDLLRGLEEKIVADGASHAGAKLLIMLGDYVDRGPDSAGVISHLIKPPPAGFERICLAGNHDVAMLDYLEGRLPLEGWLGMGAAQTLYSYGIDPERLSVLYRKPAEIDAQVKADIPSAHADFLRSLPVMVQSRRCVFVHAGIRPGVALEAQTDDDLMNIRQGFLDAPEPFDRWIVHGHTRVKFPRAKGRRLGIDTGAFATGRLTALRVMGRRGHLIFS
ncbi:metallophosphoesterase family protein [Mesorhizobium sp. CAU 1732]|uniref:metallophosphoesterase family protein n=1 Tax=Mesorhizobium sp. CAU 1732 TaxID=3140358 RepID=UPI003260452D